MTTARRVVTCVCVLASAACVVSTGPDSATASATAAVVRSASAPSASSPVSALPALRLIAATAGDVHRLTSTGWTRIASLCQEIDHLLIAPDGNALLATCARRREMDGREDVVVYDLRSGSTRRLTTDGLDTFGRPAWSPDGKSLAYVTADGCPSFAPSCRVRIAVLDVASARETTIPDGPVGDLLWTPLGLT